MAKRSLLSGVRSERAHSPNVAGDPRPIPTPASASGRPSRYAKLHVGGYFDPSDPVVMAFQKLKVDLRRSQQNMLLEALQDFVAKHEASNAFGNAWERSVR